MTNSISCNPGFRTNRSVRSRNQYFQHIPRINTWKNDEGIHFEMAIPGLNKEDINIQVENGQLNIKHKSTEASDRKYIKKGFDLSGFNRSFSLSKDIDTEKISAKFESGILEMVLPIKEAAKPKSISIK